MKLSELDRLLLREDMKTAERIAREHPPLTDMERIYQKSLEKYTMHQEMETSTSEPVPEVQGAIREAQYSGLSFGLMAAACCMLCAMGGGLLWHLCRIAPQTQPSEPTTAYTDKNRIIQPSATECVTTTVTAVQSTSTQIQTTTAAASTYTHCSGILHEQQISAIPTECTAESSMPEFVSQTETVTRVIVQSTIATDISTDAPAETEIQTEPHSETTTEPIQPETLELGINHYILKESSIAYLSGFEVKTYSAPCPAEEFAETEPEIQYQKILPLTDGTDPKTFDTLYMPEYLPDAADYVMDSDSTQDTPRKVRSCRWRNMNASVSDIAGECCIGFAQFTKESFWDDMESNERSVTVNGKPGYLRQSITKGKTEEDSKSSYLLTWDNGDYILSVHAECRYDLIPEEELFRIAESVKPVTKETDTN